MKLFKLFLISTAFFIQTSCDNNEEESIEHTYITLEEGITGSYAPSSMSLQDESGQVLDYLSWYNEDDINPFQGICNWFYVIHFFNNKELGKDPYSYLGACYLDNSSDIYLTGTGIWEVLNDTTIVYQIERKDNIIEKDTIFPSRSSTVNDYCCVGFRTKPIEFEYESQKVFITFYYSKIVGGFP